MGPYIVFLFTGTAMYIFGRVLHKAYENTIPTGLLCLYLAMEIALGFCLPMYLIFVAGNPHLIFMLVLMMPNYYIFAQILLVKFSGRMVDGVLSSSLKTPAAVRLGRMQKFLYDGEVERAVACCMDVFLENPATPDVLFEGARILYRKECHTEAMELYESIKRSFPGNLAAWSEAVWQQALIREECLHQLPEAVALWRDLIQRTPTSSIGRQAGARLQRHLSTIVHSNENATLQ